MMDKMWEELDDVAEELRSKFDSSVVPVQAVVKFVKKYGSVPSGAKGVIVDRVSDYYAVTVNGKYVEGVHRSFIKEVN